ncbi:MAG: DUF4136 domain-containing protein [Bacteroidetes bacterium]|nr:DUF4136 domain-containing protein [Bacteroidota bacterium]
MNKGISFALFVIAGFLFSSCAPTLQVHTDYDHSANFSQYHTFAMAKLTEEQQSLNELNAERIISAVKSQMTAKGFQENTTNPDLIVNAVTVIKQQNQLNVNTYGAGGLYRPYLGFGGGTVTESSYDDGTLIIDVIDNKTNKLIWEGTGNTQANQQLSNPDQTIPQWIQQIMAGFPPGTSSK